MKCKSKINVLGTIYTIKCVPRTKNKTLIDNTWADSEEMVDWIAIQFPKLMAVFKELGCDE